MFARSDAGLSGEHLFYDVDYIVYCEGSPVEGEGATLDELFWHRIFTERGFSVYCKSLGSKTVVKPMAEKVVAENLQNVLVTMDRDYDELRGELIDDRRVIYTYGYSWESDVFSEFRVEPVLSLFATVTRKKKIIDDFADFISRNSASLKRLALLDFKYIAYQEALFDRQKPLSIIATSAGDEPSIKSSIILEAAKRIRNFQTASISPLVYQRINGVLHFYGKALGRLVFHWFVFRTRKIVGCRKTTFDSFSATAIESLNVRRAESPRNAYYLEKLSRI